METNRLNELLFPPVVGGRERLAGPSNSVPDAFFGNGLITSTVEIPRVLRLPPRRIPVQALPISEPTQNPTALIMRPGKQGVTFSIDSLVDRSNNHLVTAPVLLDHSFDDPISFVKLVLARLQDHFKTFYREHPVPNIQGGLTRVGDEASAQIYQQYGGLIPGQTAECIACEQLILSGHNDLKSLLFIPQFAEPLPIFGHQPIMQFARSIQGVVVGIQSDAQ